MEKVPEKKREKVREPKVAAGAAVDGGGSKGGR